MSDAPIADPSPVPPDVTDALRDVLGAAEITENADLVARILATGVGLGQDDTSRLDLKITSSALTEMRAAFRLFAPYRGVPKVTVFGSARTRTDDALYRQAADVARQLAERGWMVVTGAGPGIMQAAAEGAGPDNSLGVSIRLPFEEKPNAIISETGHNVAMKYFFTRKLMLVKESQGFVALPGGVGTLDEVFELLTLQQTGKAEPQPIVLLDRPGGTFWASFQRFVDDALVPSGMVSPDDFDRVVVTDSVDVAAREITEFWRNYHSLRWVGDRLVLRLRAQPTAAEVERLNADFGFLAAGEGIIARGPLRAEMLDDDEVDLPRLVFVADRFRVGSLFQLIRAVNNLAFAPSGAAHIE